LGEAGNEETTFMMLDVAGRSTSPAKDPEVEEDQKVQNISDPNLIVSEKTK
jgi:hypothetical protein